MDQPTCSIDGCIKPPKTRGWCSTHYSRWIDHGDPHYVPVLGRPYQYRLWRYVDKTDPSGCWIWKGTMGHGGYGIFRMGGQGASYLRAHRVVYEEVAGPIPDGLVLDHLCRVRHCVNPGHLEPVTQEENVLRSPESPSAVNSRKTHCKHGHPYSGDNLYVTPRGERQCRICVAAAKERFKERTRQPALDMPGYLTTKQAAEALGLSTGTIHEYAKRDGFPQPVRINSRVFMWEESRLREWRKAHLAMPGVARRRVRKTEPPGGS